MIRDETVNNNDRSDPATLALLALGHVASDPDLGPRFLTLTGMTAAELRVRAAEPELLAALIEFLMARESDLIACAQAIGVKPGVLAAAGDRL